MDLPYLFISFLLLRILQVLYTVLQELNKVLFNKKYARKKEAREHFLRQIR